MRQRTSPSNKKMKATFVALLLVGMSAASLGQQANVTTDCECVPYYQCNYNGTFNEEGVGIIDIRLGPETDRRQCDHYLSVCCLPREKKPEYKPTTVVEDGKDGQGGQTGSPIDSKDPKNNGQVDQGGSSVDKKEQKGNETQGNQNKQPGKNVGQIGGINGKPHVSKGCGIRNSNGIGFRIIGNMDRESNFAEYPWMVAVMKQETYEGNPLRIYQCGGSLINKRAVVTAGHCVAGKSPHEMSVRVGEWDTQTQNEPLPSQDRQVAIVAIHPEYKTGALHNDFAVLILVDPVDLADNVETICLPEEDEKVNYQGCMATGWGKDKFEEQGRYQTILKAVELPIVANDKCENALRFTRLGKHFKLDRSFMCAGGVNGVDTCTGDGGGPLVCPSASDPERYVQTGIVAWGIGCGQDNVPGVYARVSKARKWIDQTLATYKIDATSYTPPKNPSIIPKPFQRM